MQKHWTNQNVDLDSLTKGIIQLLESKKFNDITALKTETGYEVIAGDSSKYKMESDILIKIDGKPEEFSVSLEPCKQEKGFRFPMTLATMFGGGYFFLKKLKSDENLYKFEKDFWQCLNALSMQLKNSAGRLKANQELEEKSDRSSTK